MNEINIEWQQRTELLPKMLGHKVTDLLPALVPFEAAEKEEVKALQGLSLKNIEIAVYNGKKELYREFGEMLFTHFGKVSKLSGNQAL